MSTIKTFIRDKLTDYEIYTSETDLELRLKFGKTTQILLTADDIGLLLEQVVPVLQAQYEKVMQARKANPRWNDDDERY